MNYTKLRSIYRHRFEGILLIVPWMFGFLLFVSFPLIYSFFMSFHAVKVTINGVRHNFVGLQYYRSILLEDGSALYDELIPFMQEAIMMIPIIVLFSLMVAIILNQQFIGRGLFRALFFLPVIFASGNVVERFMNQGQGELTILDTISLSVYLNEYLPHSWADSINTVLDSFVLILWYSGVQILIFLAGRQTISNSAYEAARIDGASPWETFWKITLPAMTPFIFLNIVYTVVELFTFPGNPIIDSVSASGQYGHSSALAWIYFSIILIFLAIVFVLFTRATRNTVNVQ